MSRRAIEDYFPIVDINRLAVPERNAFKPIYTMHKWFARRSSSVFRAILLGALKPAGTDIMKEFYKDHTNDPDTKGKLVLDPFMGGGTTIVEALRLGCRVTGIDLNPVAWFVVKTEVEVVDLKALRAAFDRLSERKVEWSGKSVRETLLNLYKTQCPACGNQEADVIFTFWVKSAPCTTAICDHLTPLFPDYLIAQKKPAIRYFQDCECPSCKKTFDWEQEPATFVGDIRLMVNSPKYSAGEGRTTTRWSYSRGNTTRCPWCEETIQPVLKKTKMKRKKVPLSVLYCPACDEVWQYRGELDGNVQCPSCQHTYDPQEGNLPSKGKFICRGKCNGNVDAVIAAIRKLAENERLAMKPFAIEGWCSKCGGGSSEIKKGPQSDLFNEDGEDAIDGDEDPADDSSLLRKNKGKFFTRVTASDFSKYKEALLMWGKVKGKLPFPQSEVPVGEKTKSGLLSHHYLYWHQMFNERQLLALATLLEGINQEIEQVSREFLLLTFSAALERNNMFCRYYDDRNTIQGSFDRHDFAPKMTPCENSVWGMRDIRGTYENMFERVAVGVGHKTEMFDLDLKKGRSIEIKSQETISNGVATLHNGDSRQVLESLKQDADIVITDPPYAGNVNYSELADFFYVWLRLGLADKYSAFKPEYAPKSTEIVENRTRGLSDESFRGGIEAVFNKAKAILKDEGVVAFTYHHAEDRKWVDLCDAIFKAGFIIECVYPVHGEKETSLNLQDNDAISYDLIHVCKKRPVGVETEKRSWAGIRQEIRRKAREEATLIQSGRYGNEPLSPADANILLIGKCLELYSRHYGAVVDHEDKPVPLRKALEEIKMMVDQIVTKEEPLPTELADIDIPSYIYFTSLCNRREISGDDLSKSTRGIVETSVLRDCGLLVKGRQKGGRAFEVKRPAERLNDLKSAFKNGMDDKQGNMFGEVVQAVLPKGTIFADCIQLLLGLSESGENLLPWLEKFRGLRPQVRAAMEYMAKRNKNFAPSAQKVLALIDEKTLFGS